MVFPFAAFGCFYFDSGKLSIESIDNTERESSQESHADTAKHKGRGRAATDDESCNRDLVRRNPGSAKDRDYRRFDWCMDVSRKIQCALLRGIQNNALGETMMLCPRRRKKERPDMPAHADDVIVEFRCVHGFDFTGVDLLLELLNNRNPVRAR